MRRPRPTTQPPPVSPWLGFVATSLGSAVLLACAGAQHLVRRDDGGAPVLDLGAAATLALGLLLVAALRWSTARVVVAELARWSARARRRAALGTAALAVVVWAGVGWLLPAAVGLLA